ncbi:hypothetical protein DYB34_011839 [Aphanomyces astaci]|uniref:Folate-Biopterin Transporter (FBT) Family n=1 Tax=Aphanomyces astaci TaxID=112090 RepID=A0A3R6W344_APHAT|nr:hypothetical protein DYB34_011839 [Aphanomyces astaci]
MHKSSQHYAYSVRPSASKKPGIYLVSEEDLEESFSMTNTHIMKEDYVVLEEGALVPGGAISMLSMEALSLFVQYGAIGIVYGTLPSLRYPLIKVYFNAPGFQMAAYGAVVNIPWTFKIIMGGLSDCVPVCGYRRKPWIILGWAICCAALVFLATLDQGPAACLARSGESLVCQTPNLSEAVGDNVSSYTVGAMFATLGYVMAACASDALVVQYAQRESLVIRGRIQTAIYTVRALGQLISCALVGVLMNGKVEYAGTFDFYVPASVIYLVLCVPCVLAVLSSIFWLAERKTESVPFTKWAHQLWQLVQRQALWQILAFRFISNVFHNFDSTAGGPIAQYWAKVPPVTDALTRGLGYMIFSGILSVVGRYGLNWNWRWTIAITTIALIVIDGTVYLLTIWDVLRDPWFYTGVTLTDQIPSGVRFIVSVFVATELADLGNEGAVYGLVTTVNNLTIPVAAILYKWVNSYLKMTNADFASEMKPNASADTKNQVRWHVTYSYLISYGLKLLSLVWLFLLPPQKAHVQRLKRQGIVSSFAGGVTVVLFVVFLTFSVFFNLASMYDATKWWRIAGGNGVDPKASATKP